jgi:hypothetical protein
MERKIVVKNERSGFLSTVIDRGGQWYSESGKQWPADLKRKYVEVGEVTEPPLTLTPEVERILDEREHSPAQEGEATNS